MAPRLTNEERLDRLVKEIRDSVDAVPSSTNALKHMPRRKLRALVRKAGRQRRSLELLDGIGDRLRAVGVEFSPELLDRDNTPDTWIRFFDAKRHVTKLQPARQLFNKETDLEEFLWKNKHFLNQATKCLKLTDRQKTLVPGARPDLVAVDTKTNELVGIELKAHEPGDGIVAQAAKYMETLKREAEAKQLRGARLMIVTGQPDEQLEKQVQVQAEKVDVTCEWLLYRVRFELYKPA